MLVFNDKDTYCTIAKVFLYAFLLLKRKKLPKPKTLI
jgi:hypothetical protein